MPDTSHTDERSPADSSARTDASGDGIGDAPDDAETVGGLDRRTLVRLLVGLGFGIPVLVEGATVLGFVRETLAGDGDSDAGGGSDGASTADTTTTDDGVAVNEELFPATAPTERMRAAVVEETDTGRQFVTTVQVDNTTDSVYELRLTGLSTDAGTRLEASASTGTVPPGESAVVTGRWSLPVDERPARLHATALVGPGDATTSERLTAPLAPSVGR